MQMSSCQVDAVFTSKPSWIVHNVIMYRVIHSCPLCDLSLSDLMLRNCLEE